MKTYVDVVTYIARDGRLRPLMICFEKERFRIDRILSVNRRFAPDGGCGICYTCRIRGQLRFLYWERDKWFVENRSPMEESRSLFSQVERDPEDPGFVPDPEPVCQ